jgi:hypothetical protein
MNPDHLWQINYTLQTRHYEHRKSTQFAQEADIILQDLKEVMRSELQDSIEQDIKGNKRWLYYSILILSHRTWATISELSISYSVRLDQMLLLLSKVITLVFTQENQAKRYYEIHILNLLNLKE